MKAGQRKRGDRENWASDRNLLLTRQMNEVFPREKWSNRNIDLREREGLTGMMCKKGYRSVTGDLMTVSVINYGFLQIILPTKCFLDFELIHLVLIWSSLCPDKQSTIFKTKEFKIFGVVLLCSLFSVPQSQDTKNESNIYLCF